jgi:hypothetical protein
VRAARVLSPNSCFIQQRNESRLEIVESSVLE